MSEAEDMVRDRSSTYTDNNQIFSHTCGRHYATHLTLFKMLNSINVKNHIPNTIVTPTLKGK